MLGLLASQQCMLLACAATVLVQGEVADDRGASGSRRSGIQLHHIAVISHRISAGRVFGSHREAPLLDLYAMAVLEDDCYCDVIGCIRLVLFDHRYNAIRSQQANGQLDVCSMVLVRRLARRRW